MPNYNNIQFLDKEKLEDNVNKNITALTPIKAHWGPINWPTLVTKETIKDTFGDYDVDNENEWMQCYNFSTYSNNLEIYRVAKLSSTPTFNGVTKDLTAVTGSSHAHLFMYDATQNALNTVWNETDNGSTLIFDKNDHEQVTNTPTYGSNQLFFIYGKYTGDEGNNIGISIASYLDDLNALYIFKEYYELTVDLPGAFSVGNTVTGDTSNAIGTITRIVGNVLYVNLTSKEYFQSGEDLNAASATISSIVEKDSVDYNETFFERTKRSLKLNEVCIVVTHNNIIKESHIISLDVDDHNYYETLDSKYIKLIIPSTYTPAVSTDILATKQAKSPIQMSNEKLLFGNTGYSDVSSAEIVTQLELLREKDFSNFFIIFTSSSDIDIQTEVKDIVELKLSCFGLASFYADPIRDYETLFNSKHMAIFRSYKKQYNIFEEYITTYDIIGDIAGLIISSLNAGNYNGIVGGRNSLKNIISINEFTKSESEALFEQSYNIISRNRAQFFIDGNYTTVADKNPIDSSMTIRLLIVYIIKTMENFSNEEISNEIDEKFERRLKITLNNLKKSVKKYLKDFDYEYEIIDTKIKIYLYIAPEKLIDTLEFTVGEIV